MYACIDCVYMYVWVCMPTTLWTHYRNMYLACVCCLPGLIWFLLHFAFDGPQYPQCECMCVYVAYQLDSLRFVALCMCVYVACVSMLHVCLCCLPASFFAFCCALLLIDRGPASSSELDESLPPSARSKFCTLSLQICMCMCVCVCVCVCVGPALCFHTWLLSPLVYIRYNQLRQKIFRTCALCLGLCI